MNITYDDGYLGSFIDEERSKIRKAVWIAELNESRATRTHIAPLWSKEEAVLLERRPYFDFELLIQFINRNEIWVKTQFLKY